MPYAITNPYGGFCIDGDHSIICNSGTKTFIHDSNTTTIEDYSPYNLAHIVYPISGSQSYDDASVPHTGATYVGAGWGYGWTDFSATVVCTSTIARAFLLIDTVESSGVEGFYKLSIGKAANSGLLDRSLVYNFDFAHLAGDTYTHGDESDIYISRRMRHLIPVHSLIGNYSGSLVLRINNEYLPVQRGTFSATIMYGELHVFLDRDSSNAASHSIDRFPGVIADNRKIRYTIDIDVSSISATATDLYSIDNKLVQDIFNPTLFTGRHHLSQKFAGTDGRRYAYAWCQDYHTLVWRAKFKFCQGSPINENDFLISTSYGSTTIGNFFERDGYELVGMISDVIDWTGTRATHYSGSDLSGAFRTSVDVVDIKDNTTNYYYITESIRTYAVYKYYDAYTISGTWYDGSATWVNSGSRQLTGSFVPDFYRAYGIA